MKTESDKLAIKEPTPEQLRACLKVLQGLSEAIMQLRSVPAGTLYAHLMSHLTLENYEKMLAILVRAKLVRRDGDMIHWIGGI